MQNLQVYSNPILDWLFDQNYFGVILLNNDLNIEEINDWLLEKKNLKKIQVVSKNILEVFPEISERNLDKYLHDALSGIHTFLSHKIHKYFIKVPYLKNKDFEFEQHKTEISPIFKDEKVYGILIRVEDVTDRVINELKLHNTIKKLEQTNQLANLNIKKFHSLAEHLPDIVVRFNKDLNIEYANKRIRTITNLGPEEFYNKNISELKFPEELKELFKRELLKVVKTKKIQQIKFNYKYESKDLTFTASAIPEFNAQNELETILVVCRNITEEEQAKIKLEKYNQELEKLNTNKDKLFSIIAHDLRSPFNYLLNVVDVLDESFEELSQEEIKRFLNEFKLTTRNIYKLLVNLLTWANLQRGTIKLNLLKFNLSEFIENVLLVLNKIAENKNIEIKIDVGKDIYITADPDLLNIVLRNLLSNAIKFTTEGGVVHLMAIGHEEFVEIMVRDTGVGMSTEKIQSLFQVDKAKSERGTAGEKGSGLGLILVKDIIDLHQGSINVESEVGKGTTIKIKLPKVIV